MSPRNLKIFRVLFWCAIAIAFSCIAMVEAEGQSYPPDQPNAPKSVNKVAASANAASIVPPWTGANEGNPAGSFRYTINGWEDAALWRIEGEEAKVKFIDNIHPLVWMLLVVLLACGLAVMASDEKHVQRLWSK